MRHNLSTVLVSHTGVIQGHHQLPFNTFMSSQRAHNLLRNDPNNMNRLWLAQQQMRVHSRFAWTRAGDRNDENKNYWNSPKMPSETITILFIAPT